MRWQMRPLGLLCSSAFMMMTAMVVALLTNFSGLFPSDTLTPQIRADVTVLVLAMMMTISLSRVPVRNLDPIRNRRSVSRAVILGMLVSSFIPLAGYFILSGTAYSDYAVGLVFLAATPFAASVVPLSFILRGDLDHAARSTIIIYLLSLAWIPFIILISIGQYVDMGTVVMTVFQIIAVPLLLSRLFTKLCISRETMSAFMNICIFLLVWLSVSSTAFPNEFAPLFIFLLIAAMRTFLLGNVVEVAERRMGIGWSQRVTDILMTSYKNKGIAIAMCVATMGPLVPLAMVAIAAAIVVEITWVAYMDSVLFSKKRMERELAAEAAASL